MRGSTKAKAHSKCPTGKKGGSLGEIRKGSMAAAFDAVLWAPDTPMKDVVGPVKTKFGFHLIRVMKRWKDFKLEF